MSDPSQYTYQLLGGPPYAHSERPHFWGNETPLVKPESEDWNWTDVSLSDFPIIQDFQIVLENNIDSTMGYHLRFFSSPLGFIASFPWWDHAERDLARTDFVVPTGSCDAPYWDVEQGWDLTIFEKDDFVYVIEGDFDETDSYHSWFKVPADRYFAEWKKAISACIAHVQ